MFIYITQRERAKALRDLPGAVKFQSSGEYIDTHLEDMRIEEGASEEELEDFTRSLRGRVELMRKLVKKLRRAPQESFGEEILYRVDIDPGYEKTLLEEFIDPWEVRIQFEPGSSRLGIDWD